MTGHLDVTARGVLAVSLVAAATACSSQSPGAAGPGGLYGTVVISPATPVCRVGARCSRRAAGVRLVFSQHGRGVSSTRTDKGGDYRIRLAPGRYAVRVAGRRRAGKGLRPAEATVPEGRYARLAFTYDPGIR